MKKYFTTANLVKLATFLGVLFATYVANKEIQKGMDPAVINEANSNIDYTGSAFETNQSLEFIKAKESNESDINTTADVVHIIKF